MFAENTTDFRLTARDLRAIWNERENGPRPGAWWRRLLSRDRSVGRPLAA